MKFQATHIVVTNNDNVVVGSVYANLYEKRFLYLCWKVATSQINLRLFSKLQQRAGCVPLFVIMCPGMLLDFLTLTESCERLNLTKTFYPA